MKKYCELTIDSEFKEIQPSWCKLFQLTWSVLWRYSVASFVIIGFFASVYMLGFGFATGFIDFVHHIRDLVTESGYSAVIQGHPVALFFWFFSRFLLGFIITYWVFTQIVPKRFCHFALQLKTPPADCRSYMRAICQISWGFYWRLYVILMGSLLISLYFMDPKVMIHHMGTITLIYMLAAFIVIPFIFKLWIINKPFGQNTLQMMG